MIGKRSFKNLNVDKDYVDFPLKKPSLDLKSMGLMSWKHKRVNFRKKLLDQLTILWY